MIAKNKVTEVVNANGHLIAEADTNEKTIKTKIKNIVDVYQDKRNDFPLNTKIYHVAENYAVSC